MVYLALHCRCWVAGTTSNRFSFLPLLDGSQHDFKPMSSQTSQIVSDSLLVHDFPLLNIYNMVDITITLNFIRSIQNPTTAPPTPQSSVASSINRVSPTVTDLIIDTQAPLPLRSSTFITLHIRIQHNHNMNRQSSPSSRPTCCAHGQVTDQQHHHLPSPQHRTPDNEGAGLAYPCAPDREISVLEHYLQGLFRPNFRFS